MRRLSDLDFHAVYDSSDAIKDFYNLALAHSTTYYRASAYLDDRLFTFISKGIKQLLINNGNMRLLLSTEPGRQNVVQEIQRGYEALDNSKGKDSSNLNTIDENIISLRFLISIGKLDVKIVETNQGIYHEKYGLIIDANENILLFSGSNNETAAALNNNFESFETTQSWNASNKEMEKISYRKNRFLQLWENKVDGLKVWPAYDYFSNRHTIINEPLSDVPKEIKENLVLFDYCLDDESLIIQTNHLNLDEYFRSIQGYTFKKLFIKLSSDKAYSLPRISFSSIENLWIYFERLQKKHLFKIITTKSFDDLFEVNHLNMVDLSSIGNHIKSKDFIDSDEFNRFKNLINSMVLRPLREAQALASYHAIKMIRTMNFSVPGSGKTASLLASFIYLKHFNKVDKLVVLGPINSFKAWREEYEIIVPNASKYDVYDSSNESGNDKLTLLKYDYHKLNVILLNYESLPNIVDQLIGILDDRLIIVFDEIHRIKRIGGKYYAACEKLARKMRYRAALTGTPMPNGYKDLNNLFEILFGHYKESYFKFSQDELDKIQKLYEINGVEDYRVNQKINPFFVRVTKNDLKIPPPNSDHCIFVETNDKEKKYYKQILQSDEISSLSKITKLLQLSSSLSQTTIESDTIELTDDLFEEENIEINTNYDNEEILEDLTSSKIIKLIEIVKMLRKQNKSIVIWAVFVKSIKLIQLALKNAGFDNEIIYGETHYEDRLDIIDCFNTFRCPILISNPSTLAESVSLHKACHDAIYYEFNFNLAQYLQSRDRIHRLGIKDSDKTNYYILINDYGEFSIDLEIYEKLGKKESLMKDAIERGELFTQKNVSIDEITKSIEEKLKDD